VSARKELRKKLNCKSFDWYLKNIFPELFIPGDALANGEASLSQTNCHKLYYWSFCSLLRIFHMNYQINLFLVEKS